MKTIVIDIDDTLLKFTTLGRLLRLLAKQLFKLALFIQKPDRDLIRKLSNYDYIVILTARGENYRKFTVKQLRRHKIPYDKLIMCDYARTIYMWKKQLVEENKPDVWIDDANKTFGLESYK